MLDTWENEGGSSEPQPQHIEFIVKVSVGRQLLLDTAPGNGREQVAWLAAQDATHSLRELIRDWTP